MVSETFRPQKIRPRSVYIHVPFCRHRCGYCNFTLVANRDYLIERYLNAIETEIGWLNESYELDTLFLGGGTPSHLNPDQLKRLGTILRSRFAISSNTEVTAECNPNDISLSRIESLRAIGVNRVSLGVQSLSPDKLRRLDRDHTPDEVRSAVEQCKAFAKSVSLDLIFSAPNESFDSWASDLRSAVELQPDHLSTYELTYEKGTRFWNLKASGDLLEAEEELRADMYLEAMSYLKDNELHQYEISSFAKSGHRCQHNLIYWSGQPYLAFGPGASRFVDGIRETNHQSTMQYLKLIEAGSSPVVDREKLEPIDSAKERLAIGLRMIEGIQVEQFEQRTGFQAAELLKGIRAELIAGGLMIFEDDRIRLSENGIMVADYISSKILNA